MKEKIAFYISDGTGLTVEHMADALMDQFKDVKIQREYRPFIDTIKKAEILVSEITAISDVSCGRLLIFSSIIDSEISAIIKKVPGYHMSFFDAFIEGLENELQTKAQYQIGKNYRISDSDRYDERINSVDFSLKHDDGISDKDLNKADVILLGVSRSGKTPTCLYLALQYGLRAANYPLTADDLSYSGIPPMIQPHMQKVFGLTIEPERLSMIRQARLPHSQYASLATCRQEVNAAQRLYNRFDIPFINATHKSVEELSVSIIQTCNLQRRI